MSWTLHELLGNKYPIYYCDHCQQSFEHPADDRPLACRACNPQWFWEALPLVCEHEGHRLLPRNP